VFLAWAHSFRLLKHVLTLASIRGLDFGSFFFPPKACFRSFFIESEASLADAARVACLNRVRIAGPYECNTRWFRWPPLVSASGVFFFCRACATARCPTPRRGAFVPRAPLAFAFLIEATTIFAPRPRCFRGDQVCRLIKRVFVAMFPRFVGIVQIHVKRHFDFEENFIHPSPFPKMFSLPKNVAECHSFFKSTDQGFRYPHPPTGGSTCLWGGLFRWRSV